jgi:hypothetical protein
VKLGAEMLLKINLYELTASFQRCIFETEGIETQGNEKDFDTETH